MEVGVFNISLNQSHFYTSHPHRESSPAAQGRALSQSGALLKTLAVNFTSGQKELISLHLLSVSLQRQMQRQLQAELLRLR